MSADVLKRIALFFTLLLAQVIVLGRIQLFYCATPLLYVYYVLLIPRNYPKWAALLSSFALGLAVDVFANMPGVAAASMTLLAVIQPYYLELFVPRDAIEDLSPTMTNIGPTKYFYYAVPQVLLYCLVFFTLDMFSFSNILQWLLCIVGSSTLTLLLIFTFETAKRK